MVIWSFRIVNYLSWQGVYACPLTFFQPNQETDQSSQYLIIVPVEDQPIVTREAL